MADVFVGFKQGNCSTDSKAKVNQTDDAHSWPSHMTRQRAHHYGLFCGPCSEDYPPRSLVIFRIRFLIPVLENISSVLPKRIKICRKYNQNLQPESPLLCFLFVRLSFITAQKVRGMSCYVHTHAVFSASFQFLWMVVLLGRRGRPFWSQKERQI